MAQPHEHARQRAGQTGGAGGTRTAYPASWEADALLTDGAPVRLRPIGSGDEEPLAAFHAGLSAETVHYRYFGAHPLLSEKELRHLTELDYRERMAFVAETKGQLVGVVRYDRLESPDEAEIAFVVTDAYQHRGVGTLLLEHLTAYAREQDIDHLVAEVLPDNAAMIRLVEDSGLPYAVERGGEELRVLVSTAETSEYLQRRDERERVAVAASVGRLLRPSTIAVVGAGRREGGVGHSIVRNLVAGRFAGAVYPVNPNATAIGGVPAFPSLAAIARQIDLAVIAVPADAVLSSVHQAADAGVSSLVIVSSGFAEMGAAGAALQAELLTLARANGMRVVGPNCLGIANTADGISANATFSPTAPTPGPIALLSQSGALGIMLLEEATRSGLGISSFVSVGNKLDISSNDLLCYWEEDDATSVIALYLESFGNPRKFARIARRVGAKKPIVALKAGRTTAGARGASSHTASAASPAVAVHTLLATSGVIEVERLEDFVDTVGALAHLPLPAGNRIALVGNSGGPLILAADACAQNGVRVDELSSHLQGALAAFLPPISACANPVDITADGTPDMLADALTATLADPDVDAAVAIVTAVGPLSSLETVRNALALAAGRTHKPIVASLLGFADGVGSAVRSDGPGAKVACLPSPERAVGALGRACRYGEWRRRPTAAEQTALVDRRRVKVAVAKALAEQPEGRWLSGGEAMELLETCGINHLPTLFAGSLDDALEAAERVGYPVVLKAASGELVHKSDAGGVALDLAGSEALGAAWRAMEQSLGAQMGGAIVQPMRRGGVETIIGLSADPSFGPLLMFGVGGTTTNLLADHAFAVPPLNERDALETLTAIRCAPLLTGYRGSTPVSLPALADIFRRIGELSLACPQVVELDLNPVLAYPDDAVVVDAKVRLVPHVPGPEPTMRLLRRAPQQRGEQ